MIVPPVLVCCSCLKISKALLRDDDSRHMLCSPCLHAKAQAILAQPTCPICKMAPTHLWEEKQEQCKKCYDAAFRVFQEPEQACLSPKNLDDQISAFFSEGKN